MAKLKKVVDMRAHAPRKCSKVQPRALNGESVMAKKTRNPVHSYGEPGKSKNGVGVGLLTTEFPKGSKLAFSLDNRSLVR